MNVNLLVKEEIIDNLQLSILERSVLEDLHLKDNFKLFYTLELYKFRDNNTLIKYLNRNSGVEFVGKNTINRLSKFSRIENVYDVIVEENNVKGRTELIIYIPFHNITFDRRKLELELDYYVINYLYLTSFNYDCLLNKVLEYDSITLFKRILIEAINRKSTDLHFDVFHEKTSSVKYPIRYRVADSLYEMRLFEINKELNKSIIGNLIEKYTSSNSSDLHRPEGISCSTSAIFSGIDIQLRITANSVLDGLHCVIRIQQETARRQIEELGFNMEFIKELSYACTKKSGLTLITGPKKTGKNTTAFAMLNKIVENPVKIVSFENPIESLMNFTQMDYKGMESILLSAINLSKKQDVDVAFINEIPSPKVAFAVRDLVNSSIHVITTLHIDRIWHLPYKLYEYYGKDFKNIISQLNIIVNQKMFNVACPHCKEQMRVADIKDVHKKEFLMNNGVIVVEESSGCAYCTDKETGSKGSILGKGQPYVEYLRFDSDIKDRFLKCNEPWEMEQLIKSEVNKNGNNLEKYLLEDIRKSKLSINCLDSVL